MANIGATTAFYKVETSLTRANSEVSKSMERLATGRQNANAGDRSSYVAMADTFRLDFVGTKAGIKGASVTMGYLETGMRVLDSASALLSRLQELAVLGANDTNTTADHEAINLEAEAIADEFNRLMTTSTYKGRDVFNETAGSLYVAMGGRDQEMTFGIGTIDYSDMYVEEARTIAGATVTPPKAFGRAAAQDLDDQNALAANKTYVVTKALAGVEDTNVADASGTRNDSARFTVGIKNGTYHSVEATTAGTTYQVGDQLTIAGNAPLGAAGATPANDATITVTEIDANGGIVAATITGTAETTTVQTADEYDVGGVVSKAEEFKADTSAIFRGANSDGVAITSGEQLEGDVLVANAQIATADMDSIVRFKEVVTGELAFVAGESYKIASLGDSTGIVDINTATNFDDAAAIGRAVSGIGHGDQLAVDQVFTVDVDASVAEMAHLNSLTEGMTFIKVSDSLNDVDGPNKDGEFNLAHLPSDAVVARGMGAAAETGRVGSSGLQGTSTAERTYIVRTVGTAANYQDNAGTKGGDIFAGASAVYRQNGGNTAITTGAIAQNDIIVVNADVAGTNLGGDLVLDEVNTSSTAFLAGHEYEIVSMGDSDGVVDVSSFTTDAAAIARASSDIADGATLIQGTKFTVDEDASVTELAFLNALSEGMTFRMSSDTLTKDIEAMQGLLNTARVQAGSQYAALESAVNYTTDLTAQYELGYNTVNDVNFSMETAHLAKNQILQQAATAMLDQTNSGQQ